MQVVPRRPAVRIRLKHIHLRPQDIEADRLLLAEESFQSLQVLALEPKFRLPLLPFDVRLLPAVPTVPRVGGHLDQGPLQFELRSDHIEAGPPQVRPQLDAFHRQVVGRAEDRTQRDSAVALTGALEPQLGREGADAEQTNQVMLLLQPGDAEADDREANLHPLPLGQLDGLLPRTGEVGHHSQIHEIGVVEIEAILVVQLDGEWRRALGNE